MNTAHIGMREAKTSSDLTSWRSIYTDSCILRGLVQSNLNHPLAAILTLDHAIIISGPCGAGRLDLILDIIKKLQSHLSSSTTHAAGLPPSEPAPVFLQPQQDEIPSISSPSFIAFQSTFSKSPFIVRNYASNWPALKDHAWKSARYLRSIAGPGRVIPVEIGHDYRSTDWKQELVDWDGFLGTLDLEDQCSFQPDKRHLYLAQHDLTKQFPALRDDIIIPDYVYASLCSDDWPDYHPPNNDEQIILNAWLGPKDATSPAHIVRSYPDYTSRSHFHDSDSRIHIIIAMVRNSHIPVDFNLCSKIGPQSKLLAISLFGWLLPQFLRRCMHSTPEQRKMHQAKNIFRVPSLETRLKLMCSPKLRNWNNTLDFYNK